MKQLIFILAFAATANMAWAQKTGIGTTSPTTRLHVKDTSDPLRLEGLQSGATTTGTASKTLVVDADGVLKTRTKDNISAVRARGNITFALNNTVYFNDVTTAPTETIDNLNEFSGHTFTAAQDGLYQVSFTVRFNSVTGTNYYGAVGINAGDGPNPSTQGNYEVAYINAFSTDVVAESVTKSDIVRLTAGQLIQFKAYVYAAGNGRTGNYTITIYRID